MTIVNTLAREPVRVDSRFFLLSFLALLLFQANLAEGQENLTLQEAIQQAISNNPRLEAAEGRVDDARGQQVQAGLKPNPRVTLQSEDIRPSTSQMPFSFVNSTEDYVLVGQTIEAGGKRAKRVSVAGAAVRTTEAERTLTRFEIESRVSAAYWAAANAARNYELQRENLRTFEEDVTYTRNRVNEGVTAEADLVRIELERDRATAELLTTKRVTTQALLSLYRAMGRTDFAPAILTDSLEAAESVTKPEIEQVLQARPELEAARQSIAQAQENIRLQRANSRPDPEAFVGYKRNVGYDTLYGALQIDLPIRNRNQGNIASAQAKLRVAQANLSGDELAVRAELEAAERAYVDQQALLNILPATLAKVQEAERLTRAAYREGGVDLLRLLDVERNRIQTQVEYNRALAEFRQSIVNLRLAAGEDLLSGAKR